MLAEPQVRYIIIHIHTILKYNACICIYVTVYGPSAVRLAETKGTLVRLNYRDETLQLLAEPQVRSNMYASHIYIMFYIIYIYIIVWNTALVRLAETKGTCKVELP